MRSTLKTLPVVVVLAFGILLTGAPKAEAQVGKVIEWLFGGHLLQSLFHQPSGKVEQLGTQPQLMPFFAGFAPGDPIILKQGTDQRIIPWFAAGDKEWDWSYFKIVDTDGLKYDYRRSRDEARKLARESGGTEYWGFNHLFDKPGYWYLDSACKQAGKNAIAGVSSAMILVLKPSEWEIFQKEKARRMTAGTWNPYGDITPEGLHAQNVDPPRQQEQAVSAAPVQQIQQVVTNPLPKPTLYCRKVWIGGREDYDESVDLGIRSGRAIVHCESLLIQASVSPSTDALEYTVRRGHSIVGTATMTGKDQGFSLKLNLSDGVVAVDVVAINKAGQRSEPTVIQIERSGR